MLPHATVYATGILPKAFDARVRGLLFSLNSLKVDIRKIMQRLTKRIHTVIQVGEAYEPAKSIGLNEVYQIVSEYSEEE